MPGLMQNWPLTAERILDHAAQWRPDCEIVARTAEGQIQRTSYGALGARARRLASALAGLGVGKGDRVAVLGANSPRALEALYGAIGLGAIAHPIAPGLPPARLAALIDQAQDVVLFADPAALSGLDETLARCASLRQVVVMAEPVRMPQTSLNVVSHDALIDQAAEGGPWGGAAEGEACLLFHTVGAGSGLPKGVLWPHRSTVLAALIASDAEALGFTAEDVVLPLTPFWRSGAWGMAFAAPAAGCKLVLPGPRTDAASVLALMQAEGVTFALGSPLEVEALADQMTAAGRPSALRRVMVVGAACPPALMTRLKKEFAIEARCAWGMVEACGLGAIGEPGAMRPPFGVELEITDASGNRLPHDGQAIGRLKVRGPAAASAYYPEESGPAPDAQGWLETGDLAAIDANGRVRIADRADEVMSIGGAWVSPRAIESVALEHPATAEAAVIAFPDERGNEAPLLVVRRRPGARAGKADYLAFVGPKLKAGQRPADAVFVDALPLDIAGRVDKRTLRERLERHRAQALGLPLPPPRPQPQPAPAPRTPAAAQAAPAPLLYSPELEPRATRNAESEFAPIRPAPPLAPAPEPEPEPEPVSAEIPADVGAPITPAPQAEPAPALAEPEAVIPIAAEAAAEAAAAPPSEPVPQPAPAAADATPPGEPQAETPSAPEPEPQPAAEAMPELVAALAETQPAETAAQAPAAEPEATPLAIEPREPEPEPEPEASPFALPPKPARVRRQAPNWARIVLTVTLLIALVPMLLVIAGVIGVRFGLIDWRLGVDEVAYAWPFKTAMVGVVSGIVGVFAALIAGFRRLWRRALLSLLIPIASLAALVGVHRQAESNPPIHDVATDWKTPIGFSPALTRLRGPKANPVEADPVVPPEAGAYMYRRVADVNAETCPAAKPLTLPLSTDQAYAKVKAAAQAKGLTLVTDDPAHGRLEGTALSPVFRFKSDLAARVQAQGSGSRVDLRAVSRVRQGDWGMNCGLVSGLIEAIQGR